MIPIRTPSAGLLLIAFVAGGCQSYEQYGAERRGELLTIYPPGVTTRTSVAERWGPDRPREFPRYYAATRPAPGWEAFDIPTVGRQALASEKRVGRAVASLERYHGPDGRRFLGLCYVWYYYDGDDRLIDVEWQGASD